MEYYSSIVGDFPRDVLGATDQGMLDYISDKYDLDIKLTPNTVDFKVIKDKFWDEYVMDLWRQAAERNKVADAFHNSLNPKETTIEEANGETWTE